MGNPEITSSLNIQEITKDNIIDANDIVQLEKASSSPQLGEEIKKELTNPETITKITQSISDFLNTDIGQNLNKEKDIDILQKYINVLKYLNTASTKNENNMESKKTNIENTIATIQEKITTIEQAKETAINNGKNGVINKIYSASTDPALKEKIYQYKLNDDEKTIINKYLTSLGENTKINYQELMDKLGNTFIKNLKEIETSHRKEVAFNQINTKLQYLTETYKNILSPETIDAMKATISEEVTKSKIEKKADISEITKVIIEDMKLFLNEQIAENNKAFIIEQFKALIGEKLESGKSGNPRIEVNNDHIESLMKMLNNKHTDIAVINALAFAMSKNKQIAKDLVQGIDETKWFGSATLRTTTEKKYEKETMAVVKVKAADQIVGNKAISYNTDYTTTQIKFGYDEEKEGDSKITVKNHTTESDTKEQKQNLVNKYKEQRIGVDETGKPIYEAPIEAPIPGIIPVDHLIMDRKKYERTLDHKNGDNDNGEHEKINITKLQSQINETIKNENITEININIPSGDILLRERTNEIIQKLSPEQQHKINIISNETIKKFSIDTKETNEVQKTVKVELLKLNANIITNKNKLEEILNTNEELKEVLEKKYTIVGGSVLGSASMNPTTYGAKPIDLGKYTRKDEFNNDVPIVNIKNGIPVNDVEKNKIGSKTNNPVLSYNRAASLVENILERGKITDNTTINLEHKVEGTNRNILEEKYKDVLSKIGNNQEEKNKYMSTLDENTDYQNATITLTYKKPEVVVKKIDINKLLDTEKIEEATDFSVKVTNIVPKKVQEDVSSGNQLRRNPFKILPGKTRPGGFGGTACPAF